MYPSYIHTEYSIYYARIHVYPSCYNYMRFVELGKRDAFEGGSLPIQPLLRRLPNWTYVVLCRATRPIISRAARRPPLRAPHTDCRRSRRRSTRGSESDARPSPGGASVPRGVCCRVVLARGGRHAGRGCFSPPYRFQRCHTAIRG